MKEDEFVGFSELNSYYRSYDNALRDVNVMGKIGRNFLEFPYELSLLFFIYLHPHLLD